MAQHCQRFGNMNELFSAVNSRNLYLDELTVDGFSKGASQKVNCLVLSFTPSIITAAKRV